MFESLIKHVVYPAVARREGRTGLYRYLKDLEESQFWPLERIREQQLAKLQVLIRHAYENTVFYRKRFNDCGFDPYHFKDVDKLKTLPVLTKEDIRDNLSTLTATTYGKENLNASLSGGTTGLVTQFYLNRECLTPKLAAVLRFDKWTGWDIGEWMGLVWPATLDDYGEATWRSIITNYVSHRRIKLALTVIEEAQVRKFLETIRKKKITMIRGFPMPLSDVATYALDHDLMDFAVKGIVSTGETLYPHQREAIEKAFDCRCYDSYRTRENGPIAQECEVHGGLHINAECVFVETVQIGKGVSEGKESKRSDGRILITDLLNYGMPFIRYDIGDVGMLSEMACSCGRGLPLLTKVGGRMVDLLYAPDGRHIASITLIPNLVHETGITNRVQIVQDALDHIILRITKPSPSEAILAHMREIVGRIFRAEMKVSFEFPDEIEFVKSGKYPFIVCKVPKEQVEKVRTK